MTDKNKSPSDKNELRFWGYIFLIVAVVAVTTGIPSMKDKGVVIMGVMMGFASGIMFSSSKGQTLLDNGLIALTKPVLLSLFVYILSQLIAFT
ncbi:hypothetical protein CYQ88_08415 [Hydrogenovibrio sp. SC-1]|uniref:hypothetical protein n=1 Tax=Hydrogenovibrio sp. SC-1 TaxID=2065820 RepID=UPI000C7B822F|nr:hypothetical protein [Hydrogenovibrio sp. SC-1]PLA73978.1 hypothetical protein CYQ88_08415 [Hydrogenovibrio sp. SC-1]